MSYISMHAHIVFATKQRKPFIQDVWKLRLHKYFGGTITGLDAVPQAIGGVDDHIHLLVGFKSTHRLSEFMQALKKSTSAWVHKEIGLSEFAWQEGYGAFSVSPTSRPSVINYIGNQVEHHRKKSYLEEFMGLLDKAGIEYDPKYLE